MFVIVFVKPAVINLINQRSIRWRSVHDNDDDYYYDYDRNRVQVECKNKSDTNKNRGNWKCLKIIQKLPEKYTEKGQNQETSGNSHIWHSTHTAEIIM